MKEGAAKNVEKAIKSFLPLSMLVLLLFIFRNVYKAAKSIKHCFELFTNERSAVTILFNLL